MKAVYEKIISADFCGENRIDDHSECIMGFYESDNELEVETADKLIIDRGWVGGIVYQYNGVDMQEQTQRVTGIGSMSGLLLARVKITSDPDSIITWRYIFLKN